MFIGNLRRPLDANEFQSHLRRLAAIASAEVDPADGPEFVIERAWLNRSRTHGIVLVNDERGAQFIRDRLNGSRYPTEADDSRLQEQHDGREQARYAREVAEFDRLAPPQRTETAGVDDLEVDLDDLDSRPAPVPVPPRQLDIRRHGLYVDYIPVKVINQWIFEEDRGPKNAQWKVDYQQRGDDTFAVHQLLEGDFKPRYDTALHHPKYGRQQYRGDYYAERSSYVPRTDTYYGENKLRSYGSFKKPRSRSRSPG